LIVSREQAGDIRRRELDELHVKGDPPKVGSVQPIQTKVGRKATFHVRVLETWPHLDGGHMVRITPAPAQEEPHLLGRRGGYSESPIGAMKDTSAERDEPTHGWTSLGVPAEPEAVDSATLDRFTKDARERERQSPEHQRREDRARLERLRQASKEARAKGIGGDELAIIEKQLRKLEKKLRGKAA
jgi:hypothetical protein